MEITKEFLFQKYIKEGLTASEIAEELGFSKYKIKGILRRHGIRKQPLKLGNNNYDNKDWLYEEYMVKQKGYTVIADECGVSYSTILDRILYFGWPLRGHQEIDKGVRRGKKHTPSSIELIKKTRVKNRVITECNYCKKRIEKRKSSFDTFSTHFCNRACFNKYLYENRVEQEKITDTPDYKDWRLKVYKRDGYRYKMPGCNSNSRDIAAHHIYPKKMYPHKTYDVNNGITLCRSCHEKTYRKEKEFIDMLVRVVQIMNGK